jgi:excisionase family DNA binding protein
MQAGQRTCGPISDILYRPIPFFACPAYHWGMNTHTPITDTDVSLADLARLIPLRLVPQRLPPSPTGRPVCMRTLYRWLHAGRLPVVRIGRAYYVRPEDLERLAVPVATGARPRVTASAARRRQDEITRRVLERVGLGDALRPPA